ncbi:MAG TPA: hypothetical protein VFH80_31955 [Solirubrobacteraceae bacterium]|nr:hypothetical protein [Solirubrobacteraceae bacterium]
MASGTNTILPHFVADSDLIYRAPMRARDVEAARMLHRFATVPIGAFVWTRDRGGIYHLGRIDGDVREDRSPAALAVGIAHVRDPRTRYMTGRRRTTRASATRLRRARTGNGARGR